MENSIDGAPGAEGSDSPAKYAHPPLPDEKDDAGSKHGVPRPSSCTNDTIAKPRHNRGVSWDLSWDQPFGDAGPDGKSETSGVNLKPRTKLDSTLPPLPPNVKRPGLGDRKSLSVVTRKRTLDLGPLDDLAPYEVAAEDILMELEAEASLMRDLDRKDPLRPRADTEASVLSGVPLDQLKHNFSAEDPEKVHANSAPRQRTQSESGQKSAGDTSSRANSQPKTTSHRKLLSIEETLFGLTSALSAIKKHSKIEAIYDGDFEPRPDRVDSVSATDRLSETVFKRTNTPPPPSPKHDVTAVQPTNPQSTPVQPTSELEIPSSHSEIAQDNPEHYKKTDEVLHDPSATSNEKIADVEAGVLASERVLEASGVVEVDQGISSNQERRWRRGRGKLNPFRHLPYASQIKTEWDQFNNFLRPRRRTMFTYAKYVVFYIWLPAVGIAALLFHFFGNPGTGQVQNDCSDTSNKASVSWWIIFLCVRQVSLVVMAKGFEVILVDFLALQSRIVLRAFGPVITLLFIHSKGWPFMVSCWGILNISLVTGDTPFSHHWLYWQESWGLFNCSNPSGEVTSSVRFFQVTAIAACVGVAIAVKRVTITTLLGKKTFATYSQRLTKLINQILNVSKVANLAKGLERKGWNKNNPVESEFAQSNKSKGLSGENLLNLIGEEEAASNPISEEISSMGTPTVPRMTDNSDRVIDVEDRDPFTGNLSLSQRARIADLLGRWEEPARAGPEQTDHIPISSVLQFRRALAHMDTDYPFSASFGIADTREACIICAQEVYDRLLLDGNSLDKELHFDTIAVLATTRSGELDTEKAKDLIRTFRPDRDGFLSVVDFVRSVDAIYKELRLLRATIASSSKIDKAIDTIVSGIFSVIVVCIILSQTGFDPLALFLSLSSIILAFAFMIGSASAKYFEGILFILVQRPYGIGDRINVGNSESESGADGAQGWIVDNVTLFTTTLYLAGTNERATISNGSLSKSRIINCARSPKALVTVRVKFGIDTPYKKVDVFRSAVTRFVKARPREWLALVAFRASRIEADLGFAEYSIVLQHRESWQSMSKILDSKHTVHCFSLELAKRLDMRYKSPSLPVDLRLENPKSQGFKDDIRVNIESLGQLNEETSISQTSRKESYDLEGLAAMFDEE